MGDGAWLLLADVGERGVGDVPEQPDGSRPDALHRAGADAVLDHGGLVSSLGPGWLRASFPSAGRAVAAALGLRARLDAGPTAPSGAVRIVLDAGTRSAPAGGDRLGRLVAVAHPGQIVATGAVGRAAVGRSAGVIALGPFWVDGLDEPVELIQVTAAGGEPVRFPAPRWAVPATGRAFDPDLTSFRGRQAELDELPALLGSVRLVTLVGPGGAGKSRLAREAVGRLGPEAAGARLVELATVRDPAAVPGAVAAAFDLPLDDRPQRDALVEHLREASTVLILDNCEHLIAAVAPLASALVAGCPRLRILATSRQPLAVAGENQLRVPPLDEPDAARLFLDRAAAHGWRPSHADDERAVTDLCHAVDRLPLAIEIMAGWTATLSAAELLAACRQPAGLLDRVDPGARDDRHRSLRAVLGWSYELLSPTEQEALEDLSVLAGRFDLAVAAALLDRRGPDGEAAVALTVRSLVERSLLTVERRGARTLFHLHETVRAYAGSRLEERGGRRRQLLRLGEHLAATLADRPDDDAWVDEVDSRYGLLVTTIDDLVEVSPSIAAILAVTVSRYLRARNNLGSGIEQLTSWAARLPTSIEARRLAGQMVCDLTAVYRVAEADHWRQRHEAMTAELGRPDLDRPPALLAAYVALFAEGLIDAAELSRAVLAAVDAGGPGAPSANARMEAAWILSCAEWGLGRPEESAAAGRLALGLARELGERQVVRLLAANLVNAVVLRTGPAPQAANILRWIDDSRFASETSCPLTTPFAVVVALELGRLADAARLARLLVERRFPGEVYAEWEDRPEDLQARVEAADPEAWAAAVAAPLLTPDGARHLIRSVLTDPALPPQADPIDVDGPGPTPASGPTPAAPAGAPVGRLASAAVQALTAGGDRRRHMRGEALFRQGEPATAVHLVLAGWVAQRSVSADGETATLNVAGPGDLVGELSLLRPGEPRPLGAVALCPVETVAFRPAELAELGRRHPAVQQVLVDHLLDQVRLLSGSLTDALSLPAEKRVLRRLVDLCAVYRSTARPAASAGADSIPPVTVPLTQDELATMAGTSRPTVNRVLRQAEGEGYLRLGRGRIVVDDLDALRRAAEVEGRYWMPWSSA